MASPSPIRRANFNPPFSLSPRSLKRLHVPAVTIFKNLTNIIIAAGAW